MILVDWVGTGIWTGARRAEIGDGIEYGELGEHGDGFENGKEHNCVLWSLVCLHR
jgi:hypothetical protein